MTTLKETVSIPFDGVFHQQLDDIKEARSLVGLGWVGVNVLTGKMIVSMI